jgi:hypothetical protein
MSPFDINSVVFHFDDFNYGRRHIYLWWEQAYNHMINRVDKMCVATMNLCMIVLIVTRKRGDGRYYFCQTLQTSRHEKDATWSELTWFETTVLMDNLKWHDCEFGINNGWINTDVRYRSICLISEICKGRSFSFHNTDSSQ